jgi:predicted short-subunit dehydrogenase-like oxidoreductase (DUF2520 family)
MPGRHGGYAAQAKRRDEEYVACLHCGQRSHRWQAELADADPDEPVTVMKIAGLTIFCLFLWGTIIYGGLIIGEALL